MRDCVNENGVGVEAVVNEVRVLRHPSTSDTVTNRSKRFRKCEHVRHDLSKIRVEVQRDIWANAAVMLANFNEFYPCFEFKAQI